MALPPTREARDANLDRLEEVFNAWYDKEKLRISNENNFLQQVLDARAATATGVQNLTVMTDIVLSEIDALVRTG